MITRCTRVSRAHGGQQRAMLMPGCLCSVATRRSNQRLDINDCLGRPGSLGIGHMPWAAHNYPVSKLTRHGAPHRAKSPPPHPNPHSQKRPSPRPRASGASRPSTRGELRDWRRSAAAFSRHLPRPIRPPVPPRLCSCHTAPRRQHRRPPHPAPDENEPPHDRQPNLRDL